MVMTAKQLRFVDEYLIDLNSTQAAIRAGGSPKTARVIAAHNLAKLNIQPAVAERMQGRSGRGGDHRAPARGLAIIGGSSYIWRANERQAKQY
ncbi:phage terminase, small subunit [Pseudomonas sp. GM21]|jgi:hypothetical protein|nr:MULTISPECIES: terminase small subunit [Pseudomonas]EJM20989.1 phage terminase, small subunit [Pseudomonas sp. GM21]MDR6925903.1 hypothetical protein [Pseudomonas sp. BE134]MDR7283198.1 hypothetical protein [Pseudomonas corrugata]